jgi:hypothetical protein
MSGIVYHAQNAIFPAFYGEIFPTKVRLAGMAIGTQIGFAIAGFGPGIAAGIAGTGSHGWITVAGYTLGSCVIAAIAAATARETYTTPLQEIDDRAAGTDRKVPARTGRSKTSILIRSPIPADLLASPFSIETRRLPHLTDVGPVTARGLGSRTVDHHRRTPSE